MMRRAVVVALAVAGLAACGHDEPYWRLSEHCLPVVFPAKPWAEDLSTAIFACLREHPHALDPDPSMPAWITDGTHTH